MVATTSSKFINIVNACINLGLWPSHFKMSTIVIISKLNKLLYNFSKSFCLIVLLNTLSKLFEKIISEQLQFRSLSNNFVHSCQLGRLKQQSTTDIRIALTHFIQLGWIKNLTMNMLAFNITQFFPLLNYHLLSLILNKVGFDPKVLLFFKNYLIERKTKYL